MTKEKIEHLIEKTADFVLGSEKIVVFTGAGISTESGIPDFRSPGGIWTKYDPDIFTYSRFLHDEEARKLHWELLGGNEFIPSHAKPNPAHYAIAELEEIGKLDCVITQNVDGLHEAAFEEKAGTPVGRIIHLHGTMERSKCLSCGELYPMDEIRKWLAAGAKVPDCPGCGGLLKPDAVFFGEAMPVWETSEARKRSESCDLCIVIGSSLVVFPAAFMPRYAVQSGAKLVIINRDPTDLDGSADVCIHEAAGATMTSVMYHVRKKLSNT